MTATATQRLLIDTARQVVEDRVLGLIDESERAEEFPEALLPILRDAGLLAGTLPEEFGGSGLDYVSHAYVVEEVSRHWQVLGSVVTMASGPVGLGLLRFGTPEQQQRWLLPLGEGRAIAGYALSEPDAGTDAGAMRLRADRTADGWQLRGTKMWIDWAGNGDFFLTFARTDPESTGASGVTAFIVERGAEGFSTRVESGKLGMRALSVGELLFDDCRIPDEHRIGKVGEGFRVAMDALEEARLGVAARLTGGIRGCLEESVAYANERQAFGRPIGRFQLTQAKIADMEVSYRAARSLTRTAAELKTAGEPAATAVMAAKLFAQEAFMRASRDAVQIHGANGMSDQYPVGRYFRDAKVSEVTGGTSEILRLLLAQHSLGYR